MIKKDYQLKYMTWPTIKEKISNGYDTVIIVLASTEQHGHHLAECTDEIIGLGIACGLAERLKNTLVAPPVIPGLSGHHLAFAGSLTLRENIFKGIVEDYVSCYIRHGFRRFIFISSHGGNMQAAEELTNEFKLRYPDKIFLNTYSMDSALALSEGLEKQYNLPFGSCGGHACTYETSMMLYLEPELVHMDKAKAGYVGAQDKEFLDNLFVNGIAGISEVGVIGDPVHASAELGEMFYIETLNELEKNLNDE